MHTSSSLVPVFHSLAFYCTMEPGNEATHHHCYLMMSGICEAKVVKREPPSTWPLRAKWDSFWSIRVCLASMQPSWIELSRSTVEPLLKDTPKIRHLFTLLCPTSWNEDASPYRTLYHVSMVSALEGFHSAFLWDGEKAVICPIYDRITSKTDGVIKLSISVYYPICIWPLIHCQVK